MLPSPSPRPWALPTEPFSYKWGHPKWGRATWQYFSQPASAKALVSVASRQVKQTLSGLGRHPWGPSCRLPLCFMFVLHRRHVQTAFSGFSRKSIPVRQPKSVCPPPSCSAAVGPCQAEVTQLASVIVCSSLFLSLGRELERLVRTLGRGCGGHNFLSCPADGKPFYSKVAFLRLPSGLGVPKFGEESEWIH